MRRVLSRLFKVSLSPTAIGILLQVLFLNAVFAEASPGDPRMTENEAEILPDIEVKGQVTDEEGEGLPGASIVVEGTTNGTVTDIEGNFSLITDEDATVIVSFVGFVTKRIPIQGRSVINVNLSADLEQLEEVVVVGYGTLKKETLTGAVAQIGNTDIQTTTHTSLAQKLQGKVAGLQIRQTGGQPGSFENDINIRGFGNPIYIIDGIRREGAADFQRLNATDIESISVLKDASAAIYGLGAANGVIVVTTKKGSTGKPKFNYNMVMGAMTPTNMPRMANAAEYVQMWNDAQIYRDGGGNDPFYTQEEIEKWKAGTEPGYEGTDWYDETMRDWAPQQQHNLSMRGGSEKTSYYVGFGYVNHEGYLKSEDMGYQRYNMRANLTTQLTNSISAELLISGIWDKQEQPGESFFNIFKGTRRSLPTEYPYANNNPNYPTIIFGDQNPVAMSDRDLTGYNENINKKFQSSFALTYDAPWLKGLSFTGLVSYDGNNFLNKNLRKPFEMFVYDSTALNPYVPVKYREGSGTISQRMANDEYLTFQGYIKFNRKIAKVHDINLTLVGEQNERFRRDFDVTRFYGDFYTKDQLRFAEVDRMRSDGIEVREADLSLVWRLNYAFDKRYLIEFSGRRMGSYAYAPSVRWGTFPAISAGWNIANEGFMEYVNFISELKLRGSYGVIGQPHPSVVPFEYVPGFIVNSGGSWEFEEGVETVGISAPIAANPTLRWTEATTRNIAIDLGLWTNKVTLTAEYYTRDLEGIPARPDVSLTDTYGREIAQANLNSNITKGYELTIGVTDTKGDFNYNISGNMNISRTQIGHREGQVYTNSMDRWRDLGASGRWSGIQNGYTYTGQFQNEDELRTAPMQNGATGNIMRELPGDFRYQDINNDGVINGLDNIPIFLNEVPLIQFGLNMSASYKGFDFNLLWQGATGHTLRMTEIYATNFAFRGNSPAYFVDRWTKDPYSEDAEWIPGEWPVARTIADIGAMYLESERWRRDASYLRLKSLEVGYTFRQAFFQTMGIKALRIYFSGFNLLTLTDPWVKPFDPEKVSRTGAYDAGFRYPLSKTFNGGLSIDF